MTDKDIRSESLAKVLQANEGLRDAFLRLIGPRNAAIQADIEGLRLKIENLEQLQVEQDRIEAQLKQGDIELSEKISELLNNLQQAHSRQETLAAELAAISQDLQTQLGTQGSALQDELSALKTELANPQAVDQRVSPVLIGMLSKGAHTQQDQFAQAVAPVIGPAIRHQIREAKQDIVDSLYPLIGEIIAKAIAESFRELTRNIDARMRKQVDVKSWVRRFRARLSGVPEAEMILREALPYHIQHAILIHRKTGLLLGHASATDLEDREFELNSGMLTAIGDFVRESFGDAESDLEEITHGDQRILLENGMYAYLAVVLEGVEPPGYNQLMNDTIHTINLQAEATLMSFDGNMDGLPAFKEQLEPLLDPAPDQLFESDQPASLSAGQKKLALVSLLILLVLIAFLVLGVIYVVRLWPIVFP